MTEVTTINDAAGISRLVDLARQATTNPPSIFIDLEGNNLGRNGYISIFTILVRQPRSKDLSVFLVDIFNLRSLAFTTPGEDGTTLKDILESPTVPKVFFDVRNDSDALFSHYKIALQGIEDAQLMENASRRMGLPRTYVNGLTKCVKYDAPLTASQRRVWEQAKETGERLFKPEMGGSYAVFDQRPIGPQIKAYCAADVRCLPALRDLYWGKLSTDMKGKVGEETKKRVRESQMASYQPEGQNRALAPDWGTGSQKKTTSSWANRDFMFDDDDYDDSGPFDFDYENEINWDNINDGFDDDFDDYDDFTGYYSP